MKFTAGTSLALAMTAVAVGQQYTQVNLVSNTAGTATTTDASLVNSWGISRGPTGNWWVSDNVTGVATLYAGAGVKNSLTVTIPPNPNNKQSKAGTPTGTIFNDNANGNRDFILSDGIAAEFLFVTLDGTVAGWNATVNLAPGAAAPSRLAETVVATKDGSVYSGLTSAFVENRTGRRLASSAT